MAAIVTGQFNALPRVSVLVPLYNTRAYIDQALDSEHPYMQGITRELLSDDRVVAAYLG